MTPHPAGIAHPAPERHPPMDGGGVQLDEYGRVAEWGVGPGDRLVLAAPLSGPIIPPLPPGHLPRSSSWAAAARDYLKRNPLCLGTGEPAETVHHVIPFHERPDLEMVESNWVGVRVWVHFTVCHLGNWSNHNPRCREHLAAFRRWYREATGK